MQAELLPQIFVDAVVDEVLLLDVVEETFVLVDALVLVEAEDDSFVEVVAVVDAFAEVVDATFAEVEDDTFAVLVDATFAEVDDDTFAEVVDATFAVVVAFAEVVAEAVEETFAEVEEETFAAELVEVEVSSVSCKLMGSREFWQLGSWFLLHLQRLRSRRQNKKLFPMRERIENLMRSLRCLRNKGPFRAQKRALTAQQNWDCRVLSVDPNLPLQRDRNLRTGKKCKRCFQR